MTSTIEVHGKLEARGRNGWFKVQRAVAWVFFDCTVQIELQSKRQGDTAPVIFCGDKVEVLAMLKGIVADLEAAQ